MKVIYLPMEGSFESWGDHVIAAVESEHDLTLFDHSKSTAAQFEGMDSVIDHGGSVGTREMMDAAAQAGTVKLWQILGTGFDHFDLDYMKQLGIPVSNCPGQFSSVALAESAMMFILMLAHKYKEAAENFAASKLWQPEGMELEDKILGIIGFGASGQELARRAKSFGMRIQAIDVRQIEQDIIDEIRPEFLGSPEDMNRVIAESDFLSLHLHLNDETCHTINSKNLPLMKPSACLINVARGALVDEEALYRTLNDGKIAGAGLDVFADEPPDPSLPVYQLPNVVVTPHVSGGTDGTARKRAACAAENVNRIAQGLDPLYRIDR